METVEFVDSGFDLPTFAGKLVNRASHARIAWYPVQVPMSWFDVGGAGVPELVLFLDLAGNQKPAVLDRTVGEHTAIYRVWSWMNGKTECYGKLRFDKTFKFAWSAHEWVTERTDDVPFMVAAASTAPRAKHRGQVVEASQSPCRKTFRQSVDLGSGLQAVTYYDVWAGVPVVDYAMRLVWSDRSSSEPTFSEGVHLVSPFVSSVDYNGLLQVTPALGSDKSWHSWVNFKAVDGGGMLVRGRICVAPKEFNAADPDVKDWASTFYASMESPPMGLGSSDGWQGKWLATGNFGVIASLPTWEAYYAGALAWSQTGWGNGAGGGEGGDYWVQRRHLCSATPSQGGNQGDFGVTAGSYMWSANDPTWLWRVMGDVDADVIRGYFLREADGSAFKAVNHPDWCSYFQRTHYATFQSPDRLGKRDEVWGERQLVGRYEGYDPQHVSRKHRSAVYALTGDWQLRDMFLAEAEIDSKDVYYVKGYGAGENDRHLGRAAHAYSETMLLCPETRPLLEPVLRFFAESGVRSMDSHTVKEAELRPVALHVDGRLGVQHPGTGELLRTPSYWQTAIGAVGCLAAYNVTGDQRWSYLSERLSLNVFRQCYQSNPLGGDLMYAYFPKVGDSPVPGLEVPALFSEQGVVLSEEFRQPPFATPLGGGLDLWQFSALGVLLAWSVDGNMSGDAEEVSKVRVEREVGVLGRAMGASGSDVDHKRARAADWMTDVTIRT